MSATAVISWAWGLIPTALGLLNYKNSHKIELVSAKLDTTVCNWLPYDDVSQAYFADRDKPKNSPVFDFTFFNHFKKPVVLSSFKVRIKYFSPGISGISDPPVTTVIPFQRYSFTIKQSKGNYTFALDDPLEISPERSFRLQLELLYDGKHPITKRCALYFTFYFNNKEVTAPALLLNTDNEKGYFTIIYRN